MRFDFALGIVYQRASTTILVRRDISPIQKLINGCRFGSKHKTRHVCVLVLELQAEYSHKVIDTTRTHTSRPQYRMISVEPGKVISSQASYTTSSA